MLRLLYGDDERVARYVQGQLRGLEKSAGFFCYHAIGVIDDKGAIVGGVVFHEYRPLAGDVEITAAAEDAHWCPRHVLRAILRYPIRELKLNRATARTAETNMPARRFLERLGFRLEGVLREGFDGKEDMMIYGVLRDEGKWKGLA